MSNILVLLLILEHFLLSHPFGSEFILFLQILLNLLEFFWIYMNTHLWSCFFNGAWWQIQIKIIWKLDTLGLRISYMFSYLFAVCFITAVVFNFNMEVKWAFWTVIFLTFLVRALKLSINVIGTSSIVFLPSRAVPFTLELVQILIVKVFNLKCLIKKFIPFNCNFINLSEKCLILQIHVPILIHVVQWSIVSR